MPALTELWKAREEEKKRGEGGKEGKKKGKIKWRREWR